MIRNDKLLRGALVVSALLASMLAQHAAAQAGAAPAKASAPAGAASAASRAANPSVVVRRINVSPTSSESSFSSLTSCMPRLNTGAGPLEKSLERI